jgi:crossover junction endodeoxyribonuclease RusA
MGVAVAVSAAGGIVSDDLDPNDFGPTLPLIEEPKVPTPKLIRFVLPYERPPLTSNKRLHHMAEHRIKRDIRQAGFIQARNWMMRNPRVTYPLPNLMQIRLVWFVPTRHRRDPDAAQPTLKSWVDGITVGTKDKPGAGLLHDDSWVWVQRMWCEVEYRKGWPMELLVEITEVES